MGSWRRLHVWKRQVGGQELGLKHTAQWGEDPWVQQARHWEPRIRLVDAPGTSVGRVGLWVYTMTPRSNLEWGGHSRSIRCQHGGMLSWAQMGTGLPRGSDDKESALDMGDLGLIPGWGRSPGEGNGNPLQYSCLENSVDKRSLADYSPGGREGSDTNTHTDGNTGCFCLLCCLLPVRWVQVRWALESDKTGGSGSGETTVANRSRPFISVSLSKGPVALQTEAAWNVQVEAAGGATGPSRGGKLVTSKGWFCMQCTEYKMHINFRDNIREKECLRTDKIHSPFTWFSQ